MPQKATSTLEVIWPCFLQNCQKTRYKGVSCSHFLLWVGMKGERPFWFEPQRRQEGSCPRAAIGATKEQCLSQDLREPPEHQNLNLARTQSGGLMFTNSKHQTAFHSLEQWESKHLFHYFNIQLVFHKSLGPLANYSLIKQLIWSNI